MKILLQLDRAFDFFLSPDKKGGKFEYELDRKATVKDIVESCGIPHTEIGRIIFNGRQVDFSFIPCSNGDLQVQGIPPPFDVTTPSFLRPLPFKRTRFIADANVIRLGRLMILLGFDVIYSPKYSDSRIADIAHSASRIVLTRDTNLLKRKKIVYAKRIKADLSYDQLVETITFFGLLDSVSFFSRCTACNVRLKQVDKKDILHKLEPKTKRYFNTFFQCPECRQVFWKGSHHDNIKAAMAKLGIFDRKNHL